MTILTKLNALVTTADHLHSCIEDNCDFWSGDTDDMLKDIKAHLDESVNVLESIGAQVESVKYTKTRNIFEVIADISMIAGGMMATDQIQIEDSRTFINSVLPDLAKQFDDSFLPEQEEQGLYMEYVEDFATYHLTELYGTPAEDETVELYIEDGKTVTANKRGLTEFVTKEWDYTSLQDFLDNYIHDDAQMLLQGVPSIFE
jgi:hypothetical protein